MSVDLICQFLWRDCPTLQRLHAFVLPANLASLYGTQRCDQTSLIAHCPVTPVGVYALESSVKFGYGAIWSINTLARPDWCIMHGHLPCYRSSWYVFTRGSAIADACARIARLLCEQI